MKPLLNLFFQRNSFTFSIWHDFRPPPYGGGNQFLLALQKALQKQGISVLQNEAGKKVDAYLLNAIWFDAEKIRQGPARVPPAPIIHRLDGIMSMYRADGSGKEQDDLCFQLNREFASVSVVQSQWILERMLERNYQPVNPVIIPNAPDPTIFHNRGRIKYSPNRKIRLVATSWSSNSNKGAEVYQWLEKHLDWDRYEFTFVGNTSVRFNRTHYVPPLASKSLADLLRQQDIFITASRKEACSNGLIEALSCGLPTLYITDGSHHEFVKEAGLPFTEKEEILPQLEKLVANYEDYQALLDPPRMEDVARGYLEAAGWPGEKRK